MKTRGVNVEMVWRDPGTLTEPPGISLTFSTWLFLPCCLHSQAGCPQLLSIWPPAAGAQLLPTRTTEETVALSQWFQQVPWLMLAGLDKSLPPGTKHSISKCSGLGDMPSLTCHPSGQGLGWTHSNQKRVKKAFSQWLAKGFYQKKEEEALGWHYNWCLPH